MSPGPLAKVVVTWSGLKGPIGKRFEQDSGLRGVELFIGDDRGEILRQLEDAEVAFVAPFDAQMLAAAKRLRWVHAHVGGVENYLFPEMVASRVPFTCIKSTFATVGREFAIAAMLLFSRRLNHVIGTEALSVEVDSRDHELHPQDLSGRTVGVLGLGNMGKAIARVIKDWDSDKRVAVVASGGLSHFTVDEEIDWMALNGMKNKDGEALS